MCLGDGWGKVCLLPISGRRVSAATDRLAQALPIMQRCIGCFEASLHHIHLGSIDTSSHDAWRVCTGILYHRVLSDSYGSVVTQRLPYSKVRMLRLK
jgi:hypothetical protein